MKRWLCQTFFGPAVQMERLDTASKATTQRVPDIHRMILPMDELLVDDKVKVLSSDA